MHVACPLFRHCSQQLVQIDLQLTRQVHLSGSPCLVRHGYAQDLFRRGYAFEDFSDAAHAQCAHSAFDGCDLEFSCRGALEDHLFEGFGETHHFVEGDAPLVTCIVAGSTASALHGCRALKLLLAYAEIDQSLFFEGVGFATVGADAPG